MAEKVIPVKVALRIRPLINKEICDGCRECMEIMPNEPQVTIGIGSDRAFTYDYVFGPTSQQEELYYNVVEPLLERFFNGYNATVLAYGQTGSGKTYSMGTCAAMNVTDGSEEVDNGVIPKVINDLFCRIDHLKEKYDFLIKASFLEIHNEEIKDLLNPTSSDIAIRENTSGEIKITGLLEVKIGSVKDMALCLEQGSSARATGATAMNTQSSRSHAIFTISMEQRGKSGSRDFKRAKFHLVDLAGSERAKKTQASGERLKEGININKGLLALGNVISALGDEQRKSHAHVPYRDSKLTRLLQDSLGGNSNTVMIACASPADSNMEETHNTLKYADRARKIKNKPIVNRDPAAAELSKLRQQVQMLQLQLLEGQYIHQEGSGPKSNSDIQELLERNNQLESENEKLTSELHDAVDQTTALHEKIMLVELAKDKFKQKASQLKEKIISEGLDDSIDLDENKENLENIDIIKHVQMKVDEMNESEPGNDELENVDKTGIADSSFAAQHALRKAELSKQLQELTKALTMKEELASKMVGNDSRITSMKKQHEITVRELENVIQKLEEEKSKLNSALNVSKANPSLVKKEKERLRELEGQLSELRKKQVEHQRLQRLKDQGDNKITKLDGEIQSMKQMKVKLMRQMKEESEKFRQWKLNKDKEINQLKQQGRKRQFEYKKLESVHLKQQAVLRRKTEEASAANKRLKAALCKQKEASEKRNQSAHHQNKQSESVLERMKSWLTHEVEVMVSSSEARNALKEIIEDRKTLSQEITLHKTELQTKLYEPPRKRVSLDNGGHKSEESEILKIRKRIQDLEIDLEVRSSQITELQQKIIDAEQGERTKYRWNNVHTMAEAKAGLKALLNWVVEAKIKQGQLIKEKEDCRRLSVETGSELEEIKTRYEQKISSLIVQQENEMISAQKYHEEKKVNELYISELETENGGLKQRLEAFSKVLSPEHKVKKKAAKPKPDIISVDELSESESPFSLCELDDDYVPSSTDCDSEYCPTPVNKQKPRKVRKSGITTNSRRIFKAYTMTTCSCKGYCDTRRCKCKSQMKRCSDSCFCSKINCCNRNQVENVVAESPKTERNTNATDANGETMSPGIKAVSQNVGGSISGSVSSLHKSPHTLPARSNSPKFLHPGKSLGWKQKSRRRSVKQLSHNKKKLLNISKSTGVLTPSKHFVAPMTGRPSSSLSKLGRVKPTLPKNDENLRPEKSTISNVVA